MFLVTLQSLGRDLGHISRLSWSAVVSGTLALVLFFLPLGLLFEAGGFTGPLMLPGLIVSWLASGLFAVAGLYAGYLSQFRVREGERPSLVLAVLGGGLGLATLILLALVGMSLIASLL